MSTECPVQTISMAAQKIHQLASNSACRDCFRSRSIGACALSGQHARSRHLSSSFPLLDMPITIVLCLLCRLLAPIITNNNWKSPLGTVEAIDVLFCLGTSLGQYRASRACPVAGNNNNELQGREQQWKHSSVTLDREEDPPTCRVPLPCRARC